MKFIRKRLSYLSILESNKSADKYLIKNGYEDILNSEEYKDLKTKVSSNYMIIATKLLSGGIDLERIVDFFNKVKKNRNVLNNTMVNVISSFSDFEKKESKGGKVDYVKAFEYINDLVDNTLVDKGRSSFAKSIFGSSKYKHYMTSTVINLVDKLRDVIGDEKARNLIGKPLLDYVGSGKSVEEYEKDLSDTVDTYLGSAEIIEKCVSNGAVEIESTDDNFLIFAVPDFKTMSAIGTGKWCIKRNKDDWDTYVKKGNFQFMVYDLSKPSSDFSRLLGITTNAIGYITATHDSEDNDFKGKINKPEYGNLLEDIKLSSDDMYKLYSNDKEKISYIFSDLLKEMDKRALDLAKIDRDLMKSPYIIYSEEDRRPIIIEAVRKGNLDTIKELVEFGFDPNIVYEPVPEVNAADWAKVDGKVEILNYLESIGCKPLLMV